IRPLTLRIAAQAIQRNPKADIVTALVPLQRLEEAVNPHLVKAVMARDGRCLYFSRSLVPWAAYPSGNGHKKDPGGYLGHLGIYAYRREALKRFVGLGPSPLER